MNEILHDKKRTTKKAEAEHTDEEVIQLVLGGDTDAFAELVVRYEAKIMRYGYKFMNGQEDIRDVVQDVFIKAFENLRSFNTSMKFSSWLYRIAHNAFVNRLRDSHRKLLRIDFDTVMPFLFSSDNLEEVFSHKENRKRIESSLQSLDAKYREVIVLRYFEELSYDEISDVLKIPVSTVGVRLNRGLRAIKNVFEQKHYGEHGKK